MKPFTTLSLTLVSFSLAHAADPAHHGHHTTTTKATPTAPENKHGAKWKIDHVMQESMDSIRAEKLKAEKLVAAKKITQKDYQALSQVITKSAENIVTNCKLSAEADEAFHGVLGELLNVADDLQDSKKTKPAMKKLAEALKTYAQNFDQVAVKE